MATTLNLPVNILTPTTPTIFEFPENPKTLILQKCKTIKDLNQVRAHLVKTGRHHHPKITENLLESAAILLPSTSMDYALSIFDKVENPDAAAYNVIIRAFTINQSPQKALIFFKQMVENAVPFNEFTFPSILKACSKLRGRKEGKQIHAHIVKCGFGSNAHVLNTLIHMYANCGEIEIARKVFDGMSVRDIFSWNSLFSGYTKAGCYGEVVKLFSDMKELGVVFNDITLISVLAACGRLAYVELGDWIAEYIRINGFNSNMNLVTALVDMYAKCGEVDKARSFFDQMDAKDVVAWSAMISGYTQARRCNEALDLFNEMQMANLEPSEATMVSVLSCCATLGTLEMGKWVHLYIKKKKMKLTVTLGTALIDFYAKCGLIDTAVEVFRTMPVKNVYSWTAIIQGLANNGRGKSALEFYQLMREGNVEPNGVTFIGVLSACSHVGLVDEGRKVFKSMSEEFGIEPRMEHYGGMVDILGRDGLIEEAYQFVKKMPIQPNAVIWRILLASCRAHKNVEIAEMAVEHLVSLEPMHSGDYILLSKIYALVGRFDDAMRTRSQIKEKGIKRTPGCSLIELEGKMYEFLAEENADKLEVYRATEDMIERIKSAGYVPNTADARLDAEEDDKETAVSHHSEKLAIAFGILKTPPGTTIRILKNLRVCTDCHNAAKLISKVYNREVIVRDRNRFHHFKDGSCSCNDYW
ncbi:pentatricopeptide repeat-containing protein At1g08070, chloroplastic-like [Euphorbia lathyris]|uniref:pentatricopeptide repeat-containing protein At1g08070, chloroplastic-like n=1 Tax=Euphorbia lathyris TaxID=212925 RepID=UPI0033139213